eukprot:12251043-Heterocapsa_arctica.AAC.1
MVESSCSGPGQVIPGRLRMALSNLMEPGPASKAAARNSQLTVSSLGSLQASHLYSLWKEVSSVSWQS